MKMIFKNPKFAIFDDVLPPELFQKVWASVQNENYSTPLQSGNWVKVWRIGDGSPLGSAEYNMSKRPFNNYMDIVGHFFIEIAKTCSDMVGDENEWVDLALRSYIYPRGTKLSWHNDSATYAGAFSFYVHPKWGSTWGGELMVAEVPPFSELKQKPLVGPHLEHEWEDEYINVVGAGQWISPKPNRCVIMAPGVYHSINRVDPDAGDNARCSITGFLIKKNNVNNSDDLKMEIKTI